MNLILTGLCCTVFVVAAFASEQSIQVTGRIQCCRNKQPETQTAPPPPPPREPEPVEPPHENSEGQKKQPQQIRHKEDKPEHKDHQKGQSEQNKNPPGARATDATTIPEVTTTPEPITLNPDQENEAMRKRRAISKTQETQQQQQKEQVDWDPSTFDNVDEDCQDGKGTKGTKGGKCEPKGVKGQQLQQQKEQKHKGVVSSRIEGHPKNVHQQKQQQQSKDSEFFGDVEDCSDGKGTKGGKCEIKGQQVQQQQNKDIPQIQVQDNQSKHDDTQEVQQQQKGQSDWDPSDMGGVDEDCQDGKGTKGTKGGKCETKGGKGQQVQQQQKKDFEQIQKSKSQHSRIKRNELLSCEAPQRATVELWDHFAVLSDDKLHEMLIQNQEDFGFQWSDSKIFPVEPIVKVNVQCPDGTEYKNEFDYTKERPKSIVQNIVIPMEHQ